MNTNTDNIILHYVTPEQLKTMLQELIQEEVEQMFTKLQETMGEDDLISTGTASRLLGVCTKKFRVLAELGYFDVYSHLKERRFSRGGILRYRNQYKLKKRRRLQ